MLRHCRDAVPCQFFWRKYAMFMNFCKIVGVLNPEVKYTKSQPISRALHAYADLVSKRVGAPAPRVGGRPVFML